MRKLSFPGETPDYCAAREDLLLAEIALRAQTEKVAAMRRTLPPGGEVPEDYAFDRMDDGGNTSQVRLSQLFADYKDNLLVYSFMYGPDMDKPCPMCSSMLDALNGNARQISERINLAIVARSPIERIESFARQRGWTDLPMLSCAGNAYNRDYFGETAQGKQMPMANSFVRQDNRIQHVWGSELLYADIEGQPRHVDLLWPLWNTFDLTRAGRGTDWYPPL